MTKKPDYQSLSLEQAGSWHVRLLSTDASEADWLAFEQWLSSDPEHRHAYDQIESIWAEIEDLVALGDGHGALGSSEAIWRSSSSFASRPILNRRLVHLLFPIHQYWGAIATGFAVVAIALVVMLWPPSTITYQTAKGETKAITLSDGTRIYLNSGSTIKVALRKNVREVAMGDAEASFDVAKDVGRPFVIAVGDRKIRVVGTEFNILHQFGHLTVTLRRGRLDVLAAQSVSVIEPVHLSPGQQLSHSEGQQSYTVQKVNADNAFAWQNGHVVYHDVSLGDVLSDLNRYFSLPLRADKDASALKFSGVLTVDTENAVVQRLEEFLPVEASRSKTEIVLRHKSQR